MRIPNSRLLRTSLFGDAVFETICGVAAITGSNALAASTNWNPPESFVIAGVLLLTVALLLFWVLSRPQVNYSLSQIFALLNLVFAVVGIFVLIAFWSALADGARWMSAFLAYWNRWDYGDFAPPALTATVSSYSLEHWQGS